MSAVLRPAVPGEPAALRGGSDTGAVWRQVRLGLCEDYPEESVGRIEIERDLDLLRQSGLSILKVSVPWVDVNPAPGRYHWAHMDAMVDAAEARGVTLLPYVCYTPWWASTGGPADHWRCPPADYGMWATFMRELASRYRGRIKSWEIWTEPDNPEFWYGTLEQYARLLKVGADAVRAADPEAAVVLGGIAWNTDWLRVLFRDHGVSAACDAVNLHNYFETWIDQPIEDIVGYVGRVVDVVARHGDGQRLWMAEFGYSSFRRDAWVSNQYDAYYAYEHTAAFQAQQLVRSHALLLSTGALETIAWYEMRDLTPDARIIGDVNNRHLGLCDAALAPKPALAAMRFVARLMNGSLRCVDGQVSILRGGRSNAHAHVFERAEGGRVIVAWLQTHVHGHRRRHLGSPGEQIDARQETIELRFPLDRANIARVCDELGRVRQESPVTPSEGTAASIRLLLRGGETTVAELLPAPATNVVGGVSTDETTLTR